MRVHTRGVLALALLLLANPAAAATAGSWARGCQSGQTTLSVGPGSIACWEPTANDDASPILGVVNCENFTVMSFDDLNGDGTASTVAWTVQSCPVPASDATVDTDAERDLACGTLPGTGTLTGVDAEMAFDAVWVRVVGDGVGIIADPRIIVHCAQGPGQ